MPGMPSRASCCPCTGRPITSPSRSPSIAISPPPAVAERFARTPRAVPAAFGLLARTHDLDRFVRSLSRPEALERLGIWQLHLPERHELPPERLRDIASRCVLTGGQIRNIVLAAALLVDDGPIEETHLLEALRRDYERRGTLCPL